MLDRFFDELWMLLYFCLMWAMAQAFAFVFLGINTSAAAFFGITSVGGTLHYLLVARFAYAGALRGRDK